MKYNKDEYLPEESRTLEILYSAAVAVEDIARIMGRSKPSIFVFASKHGIVHAGHIKRFVTCMQCGSNFWATPKKATCKKCADKEYHRITYDPEREHARYLRNINALKRSRRRYYLANREMSRTKTKEWTANNPEKARAIWKKSHARPEAKARVKVRARERYAEDPDASRTLLHKKRQGRRGAAGSFSKLEWAAIKSKQQNLCAECKARVSLTVDHIVPIARGGSNFAFNIQGLCQPCNSRKSAKLVTPEISLFDRVVA